jgi:hypothetical protein
MRAANSSAVITTIKISHATSYTGQNDVTTKKLTL